MEKASKVMYVIANIFSWIEVVLSIVMIVFISLALANIGDFAKILAEAGVNGGIATIVMFSIAILVNLVLIALVRKAGDKKSSKGWDILVLILGVLGWNIFYILGGIFGLVARR